MVVFRDIMKLLESWDLKDAAITSNLGSEKINTNRREKQDKWIYK